MYLVESNLPLLARALCLIPVGSELAYRFLLVSPSECCNTVSSIQCSISRLASVEAGLVAPSGTWVFLSSIAHRAPSVWTLWGEGISKGSCCCPEEWSPISVHTWLVLVTVLSSIFGSISDNHSDDNGDGLSMGINSVFSRHRSFQWDGGNSSLSIECTVVNKLSNITWNWVVILPVVRFKTCGTSEEWTLLSPQKIPRLDLCSHDVQNSIEVLDQIVPCLTMQRKTAHGLGLIHS